MNTKEIKQIAKDNLHGRFGTTLLAEVACDAVKGIANLVPFGLLIVSGPLNVGLRNVYVKGNRQEEVSIEDLLYGFKLNFGENFLAPILKTVFVLLWSLLFVVPGIVKAFSYVMTDYILARETDITAFDAIKKSKELMKGHKMEYFLFMLSFFGWFLLTIVTLGIAAFFCVPYIEAAKTEFFRRVYEG